jgi:uncharacterized membrane protein
LAIVERGWVLVGVAAGWLGACVVTKPAGTSEPFALRLNGLAPAGAALAASASASAMLVAMRWVVVTVCLLRCARSPVAIGYAADAGVRRLTGGWWRLEAGWVAV